MHIPRNLAEIDFANRGIARLRSRPHKEVTHEMIRTVLTLRSTSDAQAESILELYRAEQILQESLDLTRALASEISVATDGSGEVLVTAVWPDEAAYQEWIDHPNRGRAAPELETILAGAEIGVGKTFRIDHSVSK